MPAPARAVRPLGAVAVAFWTAAVVLYGVLGAFFQPFFLLGFWESIPLLLALTWISVHVLPRAVRAARRR